VETISEQASHLRFAIARTARRLRQEAGSPLSPTLTAALATIERHGPLTPSELARREHVQRPSATKVIARFEADGLVTRTADPADARSSLIAISATGRGLLLEARSRKDAFLAQRLEDLNTEDRETLAKAAALLEGLL
jgi:DNA-binding MarR family transcriptional regulator